MAVRRIIHIPDVLNIQHIVIDFERLVEMTAGRNSWHIDVCYCQRGWKNYTCPLKRH